MVQARHSPSTSSTGPTQWENPVIHELMQFRTDPDPCAYLKDRQARTDFHLMASLDASEYAALLQAGFRRFGRLIFHPACAACRLCIPIRVPVDRFRLTKSQRRVMRKNRDTVLELGEPGVDEERLEVYHAFHRERADTVGWSPQSITVEEYARTWIDNAVPTLELRYRVGGRLVAVAYVDESPAGLNSIYCYYHPDFRDRSPGTFDVLREIELTREKGLPYVYLGYYVPGCRSMEYKANFRPAEVRIGGAWIEFVEGMDWPAISPPPRP